MADTESQGANASAPWSGAIIAGIGVGALVRIPVPNTQGLCIQLHAPGGYRGSTSTLFFVEDPGKKFGRQLRLDYGPRKLPNGNVVIDYHWNQSKTFPTFGIPDHSPAGRVGEVLHRGAHYYRYVGRFVAVVGVTLDVVTVVQANKPLRQAAQVVTGWAGAWTGCKVLGAGGGAVGLWAGSAAPVVGNAAGAAIGGIGGCIIGGAAGYWVGSEVAGIVYDWAEQTSFRPLLQSSESEVRAWLRRDGN